MILCVSPNPALDRTLVVSQFVPGTVHRTRQTLLLTDGKGASVARAVRILGGRALCAGFLGGRTGQFVAELAEAEGLPTAWTWIDSETRTNVIIVDSESGEASVINEQGPTVSVDDWARLKVDVLRQAQNADLVCLSGSLPPGSPVETFSNLIRALQGAGHRIWVDTSGAALATALTVSRINIKVNASEAAAVLGRKIESVEEAVNAGAEFRQRGINHVAITIGKLGAVLITDTGYWFAQPPKVKPICEVGSGDSFMAGLLTGLTVGIEPGESLRRAVAAGAANTLSVGSGSFAREDFEHILEASVSHAMS